MFLTTEATYFTADIGRHHTMADADLVSVRLARILGPRPIPDWLPFGCDACREVYCRQHHTYRRHNCHKGSGRQRMVMLCPSCGQSVRCLAGKGAQSWLEEH